MTKAEKTQKIKQKAKELGFFACGIAPVYTLAEEEEHLRQWLEQNYHGQMKYMENHFDKRLAPQKLVEGAKSIIVVLMSYYTGETLKSDKYIISKYAYGHDYHNIIKQRLWQLLKYINDEIEPTQGRPFTDSAPVLERAWALRAGLGWIGKNSLLLTKNGSYFFIGDLITDLELEYDKPLDKEYCGSCTRCIDACPTGAIVKPYVVDARKCLSYLTIEYKGEFNPQTNLHNRMFGCDICQDVCPWNNKAVKTPVKEFYPTDELKNMTDKDWEKLDKTKFNKLFKKSAVKRTKYEGLMRNIKQIRDKA